jgi:hypothetical protein
MHFLSPVSKYQVLKHLKNEGHMKFLETVGGSYGFVEVRG